MSNELKKFISALGALGRQRTMIAHFFYEFYTPEEISDIFEDLSYEKKLFIILNIHSGNNAVKCVKRIYLIKKKNSNYCLSF